MDVDQFWKDVNALKKELCQKILDGKLPGHEKAIALVPNPQTGEMEREASHVFVCSLFNRFHNTTAGQVSACVPKLAAHNIVSGTARVALPEEIQRAWQAGQDRLLQYQVEDRKLNRQKSVEVRLPEPKAV